MPELMIFIGLLSFIDSYEKVIMISGSSKHQGDHQKKYHKKKKHRDRDKERSTKDWSRDEKRKSKSNLTVSRECNVFVTVTSLFVGQYVVDCAGIVWKV
jgi:hypothetical protein